MCHKYVSSVMAPLQHINDCTRTHGPVWSSLKVFDLLVLYRNIVRRDSGAISNHSGRHGPSVSHFCSDGFARLNNRWIHRYVSYVLNPPMKGLVILDK